MQRAVEIAGASNAASDLAEPKWLPIRWTVGNDVEQKPRAGSDQIAYRRIKAGLFFTSAKGAASIDLKPLLSGAIVIIGTTARFSNDTLSTPVGEIQGALAHVNLALSLESEPGEASLLEQFSIDVVLIILASVATIIWCWRPTYEALAAGERLSLKRRLLRLGRETVVILVCGFVFGLVSWGAIWIFGDIPTGWRFGLLVFAVGAIVVYLIECCSAVASAAEEWAEEFTTAREKRASSRARGAEEGEWP
jgi:hypothetical protein